jgi:nitrate reductase NapD
VQTPDSGAGDESAHLAGILVRTDPGKLEEVAAALDDMHGVEVHHSDAATGKLVVTLESPSRRDAEEGLRGIQAMPGILLAEPVYHYVDREDTAGPPELQIRGGCS